MNDDASAEEMKTSKPPEPPETSPETRSEHRKRAPQQREAGRSPAAAPQRRRRLHVGAFAVTCGLLWGLGLFLMTWWIILLDGATGERTLVGRIYRGYSLSAGGSVVGLIWGLLGGGVGGALFAWVYNRLTGRVARQPEQAPHRALAEQTDQMVQDFAEPPVPDRSR
jgi:hypothetical protein